MSIARDKSFGVPSEPLGTKATWQNPELFDRRRQRRFGRDSLPVPDHRRRGRTVRRRWGDWLDARGHPSGGPKGPWSKQEAAEGRHGGRMEGTQKTRMAAQAPDPSRQQGSTEGGGIPPRSPRGAQHPRRARGLFPQRAAKGGAMGLSSPCRRLTSRRRTAHRCGRTHTSRSTMALARRRNRQSGSGGHGSGAEPME